MRQGWTRLNSAVSANVTSVPCNVQLLSVTDERQWLQFPEWTLSRLDWVLPAFLLRNMLRPALRPLNLYLLRSFRYKAALSPMHCVQTSPKAAQTSSKATPSTVLIPLQSHSVSHALCPDRTDLLCGHSVSYPWLPDQFSNQVASCSLRQGAVHFTLTTPIRRHT
jgi:hypothetical protein